MAVAICILDILVRVLLEVSGAGGQYLYEFTFPIPIPEKSDIDVCITTRTNNGRYTAAFDLLLIKQ